MLPYIPTVTVGELRVEIVTDKEEYFLGESFNATLYIVNDRSTPVKLKPITEYYFSGNSKADPNKIVGLVHVTPVKGEMIHIPANSRIRFDQVVFKPEYPGEFVINGLGASLTVNVGLRFDRDYRIKVPEDSEYLTLISKLCSAPFPLSLNEAFMSHYEDQITDGSKYLVKDVLVIESPNPLNKSRREIFYMFQDGSGMVLPRSSRFYKPDSTGYKLLGGVILTEIKEAYKLGLTVEVEGPAFKYTRLGSQYNLIKVEKVRIRETWKLPLIVSHHIDMIRGNEHYLLSGERRVGFPLEFPIGLTTIQDEFGNAEHNFHVLLNPNETIRIEFNSTAPIKFGLMKPDAFISHGYYSPTDTSFSMADLEDFYIRHTEIQSLKSEFTAPERGFYNLVFKAYSGETKGSVVLKITRKCPEDENVQRGARC